MDFHALPRRDLQALCKRNGVRANMTNAAMAEALAALPTVEGIEEFVKQPVAPPAPAAKSAVKAVAEEDPREKKGGPLPRGRGVTVSSPEVIKLDDSDEESSGENEGPPLRRGRRGTVRSSKLVRPENGEEEGKEDENREENASSLGEGRRGASRRARAEPVIAPTTRRMAAASKIVTDDVPAEAPPAPTTRRRTQTSSEAPAPTTRQRAQSAAPAPAEEKVTRGRRTTRRATDRKPDIQQEEEECPQGVVPIMESAEPAPVSDAGCDDTDEAETGQVLAAEQNVASEEPMQEEEGTEAEVPAETVEEVAQECSPDAAVEEKPMQEEEGVEVEAPAETVEAVALECSPDAVVEEKQVAVEQPISLDDSPILGLVFETAVGESEEAPVCNSEFRMDKLGTEESCNTITEEKEAVPVDEVPQVTVTCGDAAEDAEFPINVVNDKEEEDGVVSLDETDLALAEVVDELNDTVTEDADNAIQLDFSEGISRADKEGVLATDDLLQSSATGMTMVTGSEVTEEVEFAFNVGNGNEEEDALEAVNETGFTVEEKRVETVDEPHDTLSNAADSDIQLEEDALEAVNEAGFAVEEKGVQTVDEPQDTLSNAADGATQFDFSAEICCAVEGEGVVAAESMQQSAATIEDVFNSEVCHAVEQNEMATIERASSEEDLSEENVFPGDLTLKSDGPRDLGDHITSLVQEGAQTLPVSTEMLDNVTDPLSTTVIAAEAMVSEPLDVSSHFMHSSSNNNRNTELSEMGEGKEVKVGPVELAKLSLRTLRAKIKEKLIAKHKRKEAKRVALGRLDENVC